MNSDILTETGARQFWWEFTDKNGKFHRIQTTPLEFARLHAGFDVSATVAVLHDPRNPFGQTYTIERLGNVVGGRELVFLNMPVKTLKDIAIAMIKVRSCSYWWRKKRADHGLLIHLTE